MTRIYTRTGDDGTTSLGSRERVSKDDPRVEAYGTVDELNSILGLAVASDLDERLDEPLADIQNDLFHLGSELAVPESDGERRPGPRIEQRHVDRLEETIDELNGELDPLGNFILPGGASGSAWLHFARTVCRRAERRLVTLSGEEKIDPAAIRYLNRLSDLLFVMARFENRIRGLDDVLWDRDA